jgi:glycosyltransferase involved in cell wall biosynthesis
VQVLTGFPNYPTGKVYPPYRIKLVQREDMDGIEVIRVPLYPSHDRSAFRRILNYSSYAVSAASIGAALVQRADVAYVYHPPASVGLTALALKYLRGIPFVYDIQDLWPDTLAVSGMFNSPRGLEAVGAWCKLIYHEAAHIVVLSPGFRELLVERGVPSDKVSVIYNWADDAALARVAPQPQLAQELGLAGRFNVMFAGNLGAVQGLDVVLDAATKLQERAPQVQFVMVGDGVDAERLRRVSQERGLANVLFLGRRPIAEMPPLLALADAVLVHLTDHELFRITIPSKIQAYLASGRPIIAALRGDAAELVQRAQAGLCCAPEDASALTATVLSMLSLEAEERAAMGQRGRKFYECELAMPTGVKRFEGIFADLVSRPGG